ncbi:TPA: hypothetical protein RUX01_002645 [Aeromonas dhakensis]|nr:hypothetical protein [Aeromonas dhakensis]
MDPITSVGAGLAIIGSKELLIKVLGPTADYVGGEIQGLVEKCNINLDNIFIKASKKLGVRAEENGVVSPRVLKHVLDEGRFCDDELTAEYYAGVLAASKSKSKNDDRGVSFLKQLESMSSYQIRFHYIMYCSVRKAFKNTGLNPGIGGDCAKMELYFPFNTLCELMRVEESSEGWDVITHSVLGLYKLGLIDDYKYGSQEHIMQSFSDAKCPGFLVTPNLAGAELILWGAGLHGCTGHELLRVDVDLEVEIIIPDDAYSKVNIE